MISGERPAGQAIAISLAAVLLVPVLSPTRQPDGKPARSLVAPVLQAIIQSASCRRDPADKRLPIRSLLSVSATALGVVVSRGSPGLTSLSVGSVRSSRVTSSPIERSQAVKPFGPPKLS